MNEEPQNLPRVGSQENVRITDPFRCLNGCCRHFFSVQIELGCTDHTSAVSISSWQQSFNTPKITNLFLNDVFSHYFIIVFWFRLSVSFQLSRIWSQGEPLFRSVLNQFSKYAFNHLIFYTFRRSIARVLLAYAHMPWPPVVQKSYQEHGEPVRAFQNLLPPCLDNIISAAEYLLKSGRRIPVAPETTTIRPT